MSCFFSLWKDWHFEPIELFVLGSQQCSELIHRRYDRNKGLALFRLPLIYNPMRLYLYQSISLRNHPCPNTDIRSWMIQTKPRKVIYIVCDIGNSTCDSISIYVKIVVCGLVPAMRQHTSSLFWLPNCMYNSRGTCVEPECIPHYFWTSSMY